MNGGEFCMAEINEVLTATYTLKEGEKLMTQHGVAVLDAEEGYVINPLGAGAGKLAGVLRDAELYVGCAGCFQIAGIAKVVISEPVAVGDVLIVADTLGRVKPKGGTNASGTGIVGRAISAADTQGSIVKCILSIPNEFSS
jgi:hypothetical protein